MTFLQQVTDDLIQQYTLAGLQQCTLVFPMHRAGLFVKQYLSEKVQSTGAPIVLPHFTTIDSLADSLSDLHAEEEIISVCTLYDIYAQHTHCTLSIDAFYGWGVQLLNDFSNVDMALVDTSKFMTYTAQLKQSEQTILDPETQKRLQALLHPDKSTLISHSIREYFTELWQQLPLIYEDFRQQQLAANVGTRGARTRWVIEHFRDASIQQRIAGRTYVFIGFNYLLRAERELMRLFQHQGQARFYWDYDPDFTLDHTVYQFIRSNMDEFPNALSPSRPLAPSPTITTLACQSSSAQAQYVHDWLMDPAHRQGSAAVVVADESLLQSVVYSLPDSNQLASRINITKGYPLRGTVLFAQVQQFILSHSNTDVSSAQLIRDLIADLNITYQRITEQYADAPKETWQSTLLDESYYQIQRVLRQLLTLLLQNDQVNKHLNQSRILCNLIRRKLESVTIPFHGEPVTDIQIIGVLETRLLDFDHVLILNVEEDIVPSRHSEQSFLPYDLRREYSMSTREEESRIYAYNFFRLFRRSTDVTLTYSDSFTDNRMCTMSRFIMQMLSAPNPSIQQLRLTETAQVTPFQLPATIFGNDPSDRVPEHLSPSSISTYIECPRQFYLRQIRGIQESSIDEVLLPVSLIGNLCHAVLHQAYLTMCQHADPTSVNSCHQLTHPLSITRDVIAWYLSHQQHLQDALQVAYQEINDRYAKDHQAADILAPYVLEQHEAENFAVLEMAKKVLRRDMQTTPLTIVWLEHFVSMTINGLTIQGIIDRMDIVEQSGEKYLRILDYKTGGYSDDKIHFDYPDLITDHDKRYALQTLIYSEMVRRNLPTHIDPALPIRPELFFIKKKSEPSPLVQVESAGKDKVNTPIADYIKDSQPQFLTQFEKITQQIVHNCLPGQEFLPQQDDKICSQSYCPFHLLCAREKNFS